MKITMASGDLVTKCFTIEAETQPLLDEIYFTVKRRHTDTKMLFQKRLSDGGITKLENEDYVFTIEPEDTNCLSMGLYEFDIELVGPGIKRTFIGTLELTGEVTHAANEVSP